MITSRCNSFPKKKGLKKTIAVLPCSISGVEYRQMIEEKQRKKREEEREKMERKRKREERKKIKEQEAEAKRKRMEEKKRQKENNRKEKEKRKRKEKRFRTLQYVSQKQKDKETETSESADEPVLDDDSDDVIDDMNELCGKCQCETKGKLRIKCVLCDSWWHAECLSEMNLSEKSQEDIDTMDTEFFCNKCN